MLFWPLAIISSLVLSVFLVGLPDDSFLYDDGREIRSVYLTVMVLGLIIFGCLRLLARSGLRNIVRSAVALAVFATGVLTFSMKDELRYGFDRIRGQLMPSLALSHAEGQVELRRAWDGHYRADTRVNGVPVRMMVDTGASMVLIPYEIAADIGISPNQLRYSVPVTTANGQSSVAPIRLESLRIGVIEIRDVEAAVAHPGRLTTALLGMSFLERLSETTFRGDRLILRVGRGGGVGDLFISVPPS